MVFLAGAIDMDLITTGVSASERSKRGQLTIALRNWILDNVREGSGPIRFSQVRLDKHQG